jgi:hypothetical protein
LCTKRHPSVLHEERSDDGQIESQGSKEIQKQEEPKVISQAIQSERLNNTSMIVPVLVFTQQSPTAEILTYALLDTQIDSSFILEDLAHSLQAESHAVKLRLLTMISSSTVECSAIPNLLVRGMSLPTQSKVKRCYTHAVIPADKTHIPTRDTAIKWAHLKKVVHDMSTLQACDIGMLISYDCSQALAPQRSFMGGDSEPYAVQTDLGWSIVGYSESNRDSLSSHCYRVITREMPCPAPKEILDVLEADFAERNSEHKTSSQEDLQFVKCLQNGIAIKKTGQVEMPLPFKSRPPRGEDNLHPTS